MAAVAGPERDTDMTIAVLDDRLISQIAAGEVVERPASIVKELVENGLDAGATEITIDIEQGGLRRIVVRDNGVGIGPADMPLALARHATSKIDSLAALEAVTSLGFRGEALASIASVADMTLASRVADAEHGYAIAPGNGGQPRPAAQPPGTSVEVRELFARVPARRKFLRTAATEFKHIRKMAEQMALSRPDVAFLLRHDGREVLRLPVAATAEADRARVARICGEAFDDHALAVDAQASDMRLTGWIATPGFSRGQADLQYSYVNARGIRDKVFNHAVRLAYRDVLHNQRHPAYVLYLALPEQQVDVNAHPAKAEVRFRESRLVHDFVFRSLARRLQASAGAPDQAQRVSLPVADEQRCVREPRHVREPGSDPGHARAGQTPTPGVGDTPRSGWGAPFQSRMNLSPAQAEAAYRFQMPQDSDSAPAEPPASSGGAGPALGYALGQLHGIYILAQNADGLILVDMHAAHERVLYERLKAEYSTGQLTGKALLMPETVALTEAEAERCDQHSDALERLGLEVTRSGPEQVTLRAVPALLAGQDCAGLLRDVLSDLGDDGGHAGAGRVRHAIDDLLADMGCKAAIKAGRQLTLAEMNALLRDMEGTQRAGHCNHGRPSWVQVDLTALDRMFMRGQ